MPRFILILFFVFSCGLLTAASSHAADGEVIITQAKALAGGVTAGDTAGFPVTLSLAGSYILGSNLEPGPGHNGIVVAAPDVSIDLNGFRISGGSAGGANNSLFGIIGQGDRLTVKNGTIGAFKNAGVFAENRLYLIVEEMRIINNGTGIDNDGGSFARIQNDTVATNINTGIYCGPSCQVEGSVVSSNGATGIYIGTGTILGNTVINNHGFGLYAGVSNAANIIGFGNNTIINNNGGDSQLHGFFRKLFPNVCSPVAC